MRTLRQLKWLLFGWCLWGALAVAAQAGTPVRVMSFNIRYGTANDGVNHWNRRREFLAETIAAFDPDLLGTQETLGFQRDWLAGRLAGFGVLGVGRDDGREGGEMMALYYREARFEKLAGGHFWLSKTPDQVGSKSWDSSLPRMATWVQLRDRQDPAAPVLLFVNTHFDHMGEQARAESANLIRQKLEELGKGCSWVLTGDFNAGEESEPYRNLFGERGGAPSPLIDTFRVRHPDRGETEGTFSSFLAAENNGPRIDWIGVSRDWQVRDAAIDRTSRDGRTPSDHFPVTALLERGENQAGAAVPAENDSPHATFLAGGPCEVDEELNIPYYTGADVNRRKHKLDLFLPRGVRDFPVLFFIHGGGWVSGDRKLYTSVGKIFAKNGVGTAVISYRLSPEVQHPGHVADVARAFAWVYDNIGLRGGRNDRIFVAGQSAGGHLTALLATNEEYLKQQGRSLEDIRGAIPISGIYEFRAGRFDRVIGLSREAAESASPIRHISNRCPPFLLLFAESDIPNCDRMSGLMCDRLHAQNVEAESLRLDKRNHVTIMFRLMMSTRDPATQEMLKFIAKHSDLPLVKRTVE